MSFLSKLFGAAPAVDLASVIAEGAYLVDVRTPGEYAGGHVKGSVNIPLDTIPHQLAKFKGKKNVIVFCRSGNRSAQAKAFLESNGISPVINGGTWTSVNQYVQ
jgi:rhodanese-related sulfurtransferase